MRFIYTFKNSFLKREKRNDVKYFFYYVYFYNTLNYEKLLRIHFSFS